MNLDEAQRKKVADWIQQGLKLSEIQNRISSEFGLRLTYMDVRLLVDDLKVLPKDPEPPKAAPVPSTGGATGGVDSGRAAETSAKPAPGGKVSVQVDTVTRPGAIVSGKAAFTDGNTADWYLDQTGRLGFIPQQQGYRPPAPDLQQFQAALDSELSKLGF
jgi:hypothetical protein